MRLDELIKEAHDNAVERGFYEEDRNIGELLMLIVSELGEALEAHRCGGFCRISDITLESISKESNEKGFAYFEHMVKDTFEDEIADTFIRLFDLCGYLNIPIEKYIQAKMAYNRTRPHKHEKEY